MARNLIRAYITFSAQKDVKKKVEKIIKRSIAKKPPGFGSFKVLLKKSKKFRNFLEK